jgi:hypothetical protein
MYKDKEVNNNVKIATGPCITNPLRDVNTICRRSWYIVAHIWKMYDFKIEVVPFIINFSTELTTVEDKKMQEPRAFNFTYRYIDDVLSINDSRFAEFLPLIYPPELEVKETIDTASSASFDHLFLGVACFTFFEFCLKNMWNCSLTQQNLSHSFCD